jgi:hypothetical protein
MLEKIAIVFIWIGCICLCIELPFYVMECRADAAKVVAHGNIGDLVQSNSTPDLAGYITSITWDKDNTGTPQEMWRVKYFDTTWSGFSIVSGYWYEWTKIDKVAPR